MSLLRRPLAALVSLGLLGCVVTTSDDDDEGTGASSATSGAATSGSGASEETGDDTPATGSTTDSATGADTGSTGSFEIDCSMCNADVDPDPLCHSEFNPATGNCECDDGYEWEDIEAPDNFACVRVDEKEPSDCGEPGSNTMPDADGNCVCVEGFEWCTNDPDDLTCCEAK
ncbi:MAG: hypothetical protein ACE37F_23075 [Nannocystaceae bacterium]|nr:hypothetical protein [bacterium]